MKKIIKGLRFKIFGAASAEDIKAFVFGFVFAAAVMAGLIIGLNVIGISGKVAINYQGASEA